MVVKQTYIIFRTRIQEIEVRRSFLRYRLLAQYISIRIQQLGNSMGSSSFYIQQDSSVLVDFLHFPRLLDFVRMQPINTNKRQRINSQLIFLLRLPICQYLILPWHQRVCHKEERSRLPHTIHLYFHMNGRRVYACHRFFKR